MCQGGLPEIPYPAPCPGGREGAAQSSAWREGRQSVLGEGAGPGLGGERGMRWPGDSGQGREDSELPSRPPVQTPEP